MENEDTPFSVIDTLAGASHIKSILEKYDKQTVETVIALLQIWNRNRKASGN